MYSKRMWCLLMFFAVATSVRADWRDPIKAEILNPSDVEVLTSDIKSKTDRYDLMGSRKVSVEVRVKNRRIFFTEWENRDTDTTNQLMSGSSLVKAQIDLAKKLKCDIVLPENKTPWRRIREEEEIYQLLSIPCLASKFESVDPAKKVGKHGIIVKGKDIWVEYVENQRAANRLMWGIKGQESLGWIGSDISKDGIDSQYTRKSNIKAALSLPKDDTLYYCEGFECIEVKEKKQTAEGKDPVTSQFPRHRPGEIRRGDVHS